MSERKKYDSTVARIAGNLLSGVPLNLGLNHSFSPSEADDEHETVKAAVKRARAIVAEVQRTEPTTDLTPPVSSTPGD